MRRPPNASFSPLLTSRCTNPLKINDFLLSTTGAHARRTGKNAYLPMVSKGARSPAGSAAVKKEPPSATHGSLVVIEHRRTHETTVRCSLFALKSLTPSHTKAPRGPLFRPNACQNAVRVATSHRPPSDISQKQRNRAKPPPPAPSPRTPHSARDISQKRARGAGAVQLPSTSPGPLLFN